MSLKSKRHLNKKSGQEEFENTSHPISLIEFWQWGFSDLVSDANRGVLAEFIVAKALNLEMVSIRNEWDAYDLITNEGLRIEIKSAAYLQSWEQNDYSKISFGIHPSQGWSAEMENRSTERKRNSDVYIFCLLKHLDKETINPLDVNQWEFYVVKTELLNQLGDQKSISLSRVQKMSVPISFADLLNHIKAI